jgi:hypothetical protein
MQKYVNRKSITSGISKDLKCVVVVVIIVIVIIAIVIIVGVISVHH